MPVPSWGVVVGITAPGLTGAFFVPVNLSLYIFLYVLLYIFFFFFSKKEEDYPFRPFPYTVRASALSPSLSPTKNLCPFVPLTPRNLQNLTASLKADKSVGECLHFMGSCGRDYRYLVCKSKIYIKT